MERLGEQQVRLLAVAVDLAAVVGVGIAQLLTGRPRRELPVARLGAGHHHDARGARWSSGHSPATSATWPKWLVPICSSNPCGVSRGGPPITPALQTRPASPSWRSSSVRAQAATASRSDRSSSTTLVVPGPLRPRRGLLAPRPVPHRQHHVRAARHQPARRLEPDPAVRAGHDERAHVASLRGFTPAPRTGVGARHRRARGDRARAGARALIVSGPASGATGSRSRRSRRRRRRASACSGARPARATPTAGRARPRAA